MSRELKIQKKDGAKKDSLVIWEGKFNIPDKGDWLAWEEFLGGDVMDGYLVDKFEITTRAKNDPRTEHKERVPGMASTIKELKEAGFTIEDLKALIREKRGTQPA